MGYNMNQLITFSKFTIPAQHVPAVLEAIRAISTREDPFTSIEDAFSTWHWDIDKNENGDITGLYLNTDHPWNEMHLFNAIAPYVIAGSYLTAVGEDQAVLGWYFDGKQVLIPDVRIAFLGVLDNNTPLILP